jgi:hypothetical protein
VTAPTLQPKVAARPMYAPEFPLRPWMVVAALMLLCAAKGVLFSAELTVPPDLDIVRDVGFIQGVLDGNLFGDPARAGAWRWYPPLIHLLAAGLVWPTGAAVLPVWLAAGPWLNLLAPLAFYAMGARLIGRWPACVATAVFVLFDSAVMSGDEAAGYTPWPLTPSFAWPLFFGGVWLAHRTAESLRPRNAILLGSVLGLVFLAHTVPAILLSGIVAALTLSIHGKRGMGWLACVALVELIWAAPFLGPLAFAYRLHIANPMPGAWVHTLLRPDDIVRLAMVNLPGILASAALVILGKAERRPTATRTILVAWISICLLFLTRHFACHVAGKTDGACGVFVIAPHHYHVYLQAAWALTIGQAIWLAGRAIPSQNRLGLVIVSATLATLAGTLLLFGDKLDRERHANTRDYPDNVLDRAAYDWIVSQTAPRDMFAVRLPEAADQMGPAAATIIAAGRQLIAPPEIHANPYLPWRPINQRRLAALAALQANDADGLCAFVRYAEPGGAALFLLPTESPPLSTYLERLFTGATHTVWRVNPSVCDQPNAVNTSSIAFIWLPAAEDGTKIGSRTPAAFQASTPSLTLDAEPNRELSASQRSEK